MQIAQRLIAIVSHVTHQAFRPKTGSLFRVGEEDLIVVRQDKAQQDLGTSFADDESQAYSTYRTRDSLREIYAVHS